MDSSIQSITTYLQANILATVINVFVWVINEWSSNPKAGSDENIITRSYLKDVNHIDRQKWWLDALGAICFAPIVDFFPAMGSKLNSMSVNPANGRT